MSTDFSKVENNPVPLIQDKHDKNVAFVIYRNKNKNVVVYSGKLQADGTLHATEPLDVYWVMFENDGHPREELNMIERNSAYGATVKPVPGKPGVFEDRTFYLSVEDGKVVARGTIDGKENCVVERVFVYSTTSWGLPKVQHIEIHGRDPSGNAVMEKKLP
ncbi:Protein kinase, partial [Globisporangium splendens]